MRSLARLALPLAAQYAVSASLNLVAGLLIGQLGETAIAAVGLANQVFFLLQLLLFGATSGCAIFTAQYWGQEDVPSIRRTLGIALLLASTAGLIFFSIAAFIPTLALRTFTTDEAVIVLGAQYLRYLAPSFILLSLTAAYASVSRSVGDVKTPMLASMVSLAFDILLAYLLIFGKFGLPQMGAPGAAVAVTAARAVELALLLTLLYRRRSPAAARLKELTSFTRPFFTAVVRRAVPVAMNELLWALAVTTYTAVYARIGTDALAAVNMIVNIENLAFVIFIAITDATSVLVGNQIGAQDVPRAVKTGRSSLLLTIGFAALVGLLLRLFAPYLLALYQVSEGVHETALRLLTVLALTLWVRSANMLLIVGVLRAGGDTRFAFIVDAGLIWSIGVPLAFIGAFVLHLPVYFVYPLVVSEEFAKFAIGLVRFRSRRWVNNLAAVGA